MSTLVARWQSVIGIDFHVAVTLLLRSWAIVAGGVMVFAIPASLSPQQQGYYFTFSSLLGLQVFFELGLNQVVVQLVSHELAHLTWSAEGRLQGDDLNIDRVKSIVALLRKWYAAASLGFLAVTVLAGGVMFSRNGSLPIHLWIGPWIALTAASAVNLYFSPMLAVMEGCGQVGQVARLRLVQSMFGYGFTWCALFAGAGLWAIPLISATAGLCTGTWLRTGGHMLRAFDSAVDIPRARSIDWRREVFPYQWRIAVSWISGYLMFQLFTPLVFVNLGAVEAGRLGMSLAIFSALLSVGVSWINAKVPSMTAHVSRGEGALLNRTFIAVLIRSATFTALASVTVIAAVHVLSGLGVRHMDRLADLPTLMCIATVTTVNTVIYGMATYMRAHRSEPMLAVSVVGAVLTLIASFVVLRYGMFPTMLSQAVVTVVIGLPWTVALFGPFYRRHAS